MPEITYQWTDGGHPAFRHFYAVTEAYYSRIVGGKENRASFISFNASVLMDQIEEKARDLNFRRIVLQTRPIMPEAVALYTKRGYALISNYPPYDKLPGAVCYAKNLQ